MKAGTVILLCLLVLSCQGKVVYQSVDLRGVVFHAEEKPFHIEDDDGEIVTVFLLRDENGLLYWHRRVNTAVCYSDECYRIDIGIYWNSLGGFFGLEVYDNHLTKTDHEAFAPADYQRLLATLGNSWPLLREYRASDLVDREVDGVSGATKEEISEETVEKAVYTTYRIWHLAHVGEKERIVDLTLERLNENPELLDVFVNEGTAAHQHFVLEGLKRDSFFVSDEIERLIWQGIEQSQDLKLRNLSFSVCDRLDLESEGSQSRLAKVYPKFSASEKSRVLEALDGVSISQTLRKLLATDPLLENPWFAKRARAVLEN